jgi:dephospho-CoA kinase
MPDDLTRAPLRVALSGGIATGKSHCLARFAALGAETIDADALARQVVDPGTPGLAAVIARFGASMLRPDGTLDRSALGRLAFAEPAARRALEAIIHPAVYSAIATWYAERPRVSTPGSTPEVVIAIADIPLLFETHHEADFDRVVVTSCRREQQIERLRLRGLSEAEALRRLASQLPLEGKVRLADDVIDTSGTFEGTDRQVVEVWEKLRAAAAM